MASANIIGFSPHDNTESIPIRQPIDWLGEVARLHSLGFCLIPGVITPMPELPGRLKKKPLVLWTNYQTQRPTLDETLALFRIARFTGIRSPQQQCVLTLTGAAAGGLAVIDFDLGGLLIREWYERINANAPGLAERLVWQGTIRKGWHGLCRLATDELPGGEKLAYKLVDGKFETALETRVAGNLLVMAPTVGYAVQVGSLDAIPTLTLDEWNLITSAARSLDESPPTTIGAVQPEYVAPSPSNDSSLPPGRDYSQRGDVPALLEKHGWKFVGWGGGQMLFRRPGKHELDTSHGGGWHPEHRRFQVYSDSPECRPLWKKDRGFDGFGLFMHLECGGDMAAAARELRKAGFGGAFPRVEECGIDWAGIVGIENGLDG
ncbi:MAG TPA: hypothetical protein VGE52_10450, partial [Pirellulales bacterium]